MTFDKFWERWPDKKNKASAMGAWRSLRPVERAKAVARCQQWCKDWRKQHPDASHIHASTFLRQRRFLDMDENSQATAADERAVLEMQAGWIRDGKDFLCRGISASRASEILQVGLVTEDQCRKAGVL